MANICIRTLNYIASGKFQKYIDLDIGYTPESWHITELVPEEDKTFGIGEANVQIKLTPDPCDDVLYTQFKKATYIRNSVYATSIEANPYGYNDTKDNKNNLFSLFNTKNDIIVHNLYDIKDICIRSDIKNNDTNFEIYAPDISSNVIGIAQFKNFTYCLTDGMKTTPSYVTTNLIENRDKTKGNIRSTDYVKNITNQPIYTYLYQLSSQFSPDISSNYNIYNMIDGIEYNYIIELQNNHQYNDFENGEVNGDVFTTKNAYDALYSMNMKSLTNINNCRQYVGLGICGDQVFLKYVDDVNYIGNKTSNKIIVDKIKKTKYAFEKVETIDSINRFDDVSKHRSNMFSLKIHNLGLDELDVSDKMSALKKQIKMDIDNNIEDLVKNVCPIHTQLFNVEYVN